MAFDPNDMKNEHIALVHRKKNGEIQYLTASAENTDGLDFVFDVFKDVVRKDKTLV